MRPRRWGHSTESVSEGDGRPRVIGDRTTPVYASGAAHKDQAVWLTQESEQLAERRRQLTQHSRLVAIEPLPIHAHA